MNRKKEFLINIAYYGIIVAIVWILLKFLVPVAMPFLLGYGVAILVCKATSNCNKGKKWIRILLTIVFYVIVGCVISYGFLEAFSSLYGGVTQLPVIYQEDIAPAAKAVYWEITSFISELDPELMSVVGVIGDALGSSLDKLFSLVSEFIVGLVSNIISFVPSLFISTVIMIIATFFFVVDYDRINEFFDEKAPEKWRNALNGVKYYIRNTLLVVIRSYAIIMLLTFSELSIMFTLCGVKYAMVIATIIAVFDIMPVLGTGGIMLPWAIICVILGDYTLAIELVIMYVIVTVVRNYVEPKVVGEQLGLHPLVTLISMFIGLRLFGFLGLFGMPIGISYFWKKRNEKITQATTSTACPQEEER